MELRKLPSSLKEHAMWLPRSRGWEDQKQISSWCGEEPSNTVNFSKSRISGQGVRFLLCQVFEKRLEGYLGRYG